MNYQNLGVTARIVAMMAAAMLGLSTYLYFTSIYVNIWLAAVLGIMIAAVFGVVWHILLSMVDYVRHAKGIVAMIVVGLLLVASALPITGRGMATLIGGQGALRAEQAATLSALEAAMVQANANVQGQDAIVGEVLKASTQMNLLAREEGRSGEGPLYRSLLDSEAMYAQSADRLQADLDRGAEVYSAGSVALSTARQSLGNEAGFDAAVADAQSAIRDLNAIDLSGEVLKTGTVTAAADGVMPRLDAVTQALHANVKGLRPATVEVPVYEPVTASGAVASVADNLGSWATAVFFDVLPFVLMVLMMLTWDERGLRFDRAGYRQKSADEQQVERDNVVGFKGAAE